MARDPYRYFRVEARELVAQLQAGALALEQGADRAGALARLLRVAHTLKGAARVVRVETIARLAHGIEDTLAPWRADPAGVGRPVIDELLGATDAIAAALVGLDAPPPEPTRAIPTPAPEPPAASDLQAVQVPVAALDQLLDTLLDARARAARLAAGSDPQALEALRRRLDGLQRELGELRLLPAAPVLQGLERVARDAGVALGKPVRLQAQGGDVRLDAPVLGAMQEALVQLVRNAVAHGIEDPAERERAGKPSTGTIEVSLTRRGRRAVLRCRDDGRGLDLEAIRGAALRSGALTPAQAAGLDPAGALSLLLRGGLSTARDVTEVSGRGVGLNVVRAALDRVGGDVSIDSRPGRGTELQLEVPVSLAALDALAVVAGGERYLIPLDGVRACLAAPEPDARGERTVLHEGAPLAAVPLERLLGGEARPDGAGRRPAGTAVILEAKSGRSAVTVDRLLGTRQVLVRALAAAVGPAPLVVGAATDEDGEPVLVLDPPALLEAVARPRPAAPAAPAPYLPVLVIDDSLTTRMLEHTILTGAGYRVELATSAEEGLELALRGEYGLFVVDVEMPGMDGFTFVARTRAHPQLREVPAVLVSSRNAPEDLQRGREAGASAYVVKGEFHEGRLLELVASLTRRASAAGEPA